MATNMSALGTGRVTERGQRLSLTLTHSSSARRPTQSGGRCARLRGQTSTKHTAPKHTRQGDTPPAKTSPHVKTLELTACENIETHHMRKHWNSPHAKTLEFAAYRFITLHDDKYIGGEFQCLVHAVSSNLWCMRKSY